jgi:hypothetical protein
MVCLFQISIGAFDTNPIETRFATFEIKICGNFIVFMIYYRHDKK